MSKELPRDWMKDLIPPKDLDEVSYDPKRLICSRFALHLPVTRYFKDTAAALQVKTELDKKARRLLADTWEYEGDDRKEVGRANKIKVLFDKIEEIRKKEQEKDTASPSHFVVFAHFGDEIDNIEAFLPEWLSPIQQLKR